jgi:hypothetical protein
VGPLPHGANSALTGALLLLNEAGAPVGVHICTNCRCNDTAARAFPLGNEDEEMSL